MAAMNFFHDRHSDDCEYGFYFSGPCSPARPPLSGNPSNLASPSRVSSAPVPPPSYKPGPFFAISIHFVSKFCTSPSPIRLNAENSCIVILDDD